MKKVCSIILSSLLLLLVLPVVRIDAETSKNWTVPDGYFVPDYDAVAAFLEIEDENGVTNGFKLSRNYDPNNPETWHTQPGPMGEVVGIAWVTLEDGLKHLYIFNIDGTCGGILPHMCGDIDLSCCEYLSAACISGDHDLGEVLMPDSIRIFSWQNTNKTEMDLASMGMRNVGALYLDHNPDLTSIDVSSFHQLEALIVNESGLTELDVSANTQLNQLYCDGNDLTSLNIANNPNLQYLVCACNRITTLDLSAAENLIALSCGMNLIENLDLSHCNSLSALYANDNPMAELDLSACPNARYLSNVKLYYMDEIDLTACQTFDVDHLNSEGSGKVGCWLSFSNYQYNYKTLKAEPDIGAEFLGWYNDNGDLISTSLELELPHIGTSTIRNYTARFTVRDIEVPDGYCANDYLKLRAFLEQENEDGLKNGTQMREDYDPDDPETFTYEGLYGMPQGVQWVEMDDGIKYAAAFTTDLWPGGQLELVGDLDVSNCEYLTYLSFAFNSLNSLNASNSAVTDISLLGNPITAVDLTGCTSLYDFNCRDCTQLTELDLSDCISLAVLTCSNCGITSLDVSNCPELNSLVCVGNQLTELDLSNNPGIPFDRITAEGHGTIGYNEAFNDNFQRVKFAIATPGEGESFLGWYTEGGELISENEQLEWFYDTNETNVIARFTNNNQIPGDVDGSGEVNITDALLALRAAMGVIELTSEQLAAADMNGSGTAEVSDAIIILRMAMGLLN